MFDAHRGRPTKASCVSRSRRNFRARAVNGSKPRDMPASSRAFLDAIDNGAAPETVLDDNISSLAMVMGAIESARTGQRVDDQGRMRHEQSGKVDPHRHDGQCDRGEAAERIGKIADMGFESFEPFFWQTTNGQDLAELGKRCVEAIGDRDITISTLGMFGNPLEETTRSTAIRCRAGRIASTMPIISARPASPASPAASATSR